MEKAQNANKHHSRAVSSACRESPKKNAAFHKIILTLSLFQQRNLYRDVKEPSSFPLEMKNHLDF
jgi:hypothetical protein